MRDLIPTTDAANRVLGHALHEAQRLDHTQIDPAHVLLGLAMDTDGSGARLLTSFGLDLKKLRLSVEQQLEPGDALDAVSPALSPRVRRLLKTAEAEASSLGQYGIDGEHLLLALMRERGKIPFKVLSDMGLTYDKVYGKVDQLMAGKRMAQNATRAFSRFSDSVNLAGVRRVPIQPSPIFLGLCAAAVLLAVLMYIQIIPRIALFFFVIVGWVISVSLHEFGHAFVAYLGGDQEVYHKGYLTLNPLKYTHPLMSIVLPIVILLIGGLGLPGGAVYVNRAAIRDRRMVSLMSAAGPIATFLCAIILVIPFMTGIAYRSFDAHPEFWAGIAFLAMLEVFGVVINLIPLPGIDGFGMIEPFLPPHIAARMWSIAPFSFFILLIIFLSPLGGVFWAVVMGICAALGLDPQVAFSGYSMFQFWR